MWYAVGFPLLADGSVIAHPLEVLPYFGAMNSVLLSVLVPLYNEQQYVYELLQRVADAPLPECVRMEIIVVDDASRDGSVDRVREFQSRHPDLVRLVEHDRNRGKGAAIRTAIENARGDIAVIQDADLEYNPTEFPKLLKPILENRADAVFGSRFAASTERRVLYFWHSLANHVLTTACNIASDLNLTDMETCYKAIRTPLLRSIPLRSNRFGFEPEITLKLAKRKAVIYEVPISYYGRTYIEGKKIGLKDAFEAFYLIGRYALSTDVYKDHGQQILHAFSLAVRFNEWIADTIRPFLGIEVMEIGAGMGNLTRQLASGRRRYIATDIDTEHLARLQNELSHYPQLEVAVCDLEHTDQFKPYQEQLDTIFCLNVLEHIRDDQCGLANMHRVLKQGGRAIVLVPEGMEVYGKLDKVLGHYRRYSKQELIEKMRAAGFEVERVIDFNRISRPGWFVAGRLLQRDQISALQLRIFDQLVWLWKKIDGLLPWQPTSIIAVGKRISAQ